MPDKWTDDFEHESLTTEQSLSQARETLSKFDSKDDALIGYLNLQKSAGKPFKLPESLDKLPSDQIRTDFVNQVGKLMGVVDNADDLKDINFGEGMVDPSKVDQVLAQRFSQFVIDNRIPKGIAQKIVGLHNLLSAEGREKIERDFKEKCDKANEALVKIHGQEGVKLSSEKIRRMFQNSLGLNAEEYETIGLELADSGLTRYPVIFKGLSNAANKLVKEGTTEISEPVTKQKPKAGDIKEQLPKIAKRLKWK